MASRIQDVYEDVFQGEQNLTFTERAASTIFGLVMAAGGLNRGGLPGALMGIAGAALVARGLNGHCPFKAMIQGGGSRSMPSLSRMSESVRSYAYGEDDRQQSHIDRGSEYGYSPSHQPSHLGSRS